MNVGRTKLRERTSQTTRSHLSSFQEVARTVPPHTERNLAYVVATRSPIGGRERLKGKIHTIAGRSIGSHGPWSPITLVFLWCSRISVHPYHHARTSAADPVPVCDPGLGQADAFVWHGPEPRHAERTKA